MLRERLDARISTEPTERGCLEWLGARNKDGYGGLKVDGQFVYAHRAVLVADGVDVAGKEVMHSCDNPPCCNPAHLSVGTHAENLGGMAARGRSQAGSRNVHAKLNEQQAAEIRRLTADGARHAEVAAAFGVSRSLVSMIARNEIWTSVAAA